jgi:hypothetical protein
MDSLAFYDVRAVATVTTLDLGDVAPSSSDDLMLRVVNLSDIYVAKDVTVTTDNPDAVQIWLSTDGDNFSSSIELGNIPPGGSSYTFFLRRVTPSDATGIGDAILLAEPAAWAPSGEATASDNIPLETD